MGEDRAAATAAEEDSAGKRKRDEDDDFEALERTYGEDAGE